MTVHVHLQVYQTVSQIALFHCKIKCFNSKFPRNRLKVPSLFDSDLWRDLLVSYNDNIVDFLEYGWPFNYYKFALPVTSFRNHKYRDTYIETELR